MRYSRFQAAVVVLVLASGCSAPVPISGYQGDGNISRIWFWPNIGVKVDFEEFSLQEPFTAIYKIKGLPRPKDFLVAGLVLDPSGWSERKSLTGVLELRIKDTTGRVLSEGRASLTEWHWGESGGDHFATNKIELMPKHFEKDQSPPAILEVSYEPVGRIPAVTARVRLSADGYS